MKRSKINLIKDMRVLRSVVQYSGTILVVILGINTIMDIKFGILPNMISTNVLLDISKLIIFFSFIYANKFDTELIEIEGEEPLKIKILSIWGIIYTILLIFSYLFLWFSRGPIEFCKSFLIFWTVIFVGWFLMKKFVLKDTLEPSINSSSLDIIESIFIVKEQILGVWQLYRYIIGYALFLLPILLHITNINLYLYFKEIPSDFLLSLFILLSILFIWGWIWIKRIQVKISLDLISNLSKKYDFIKKNKK